MFRYEKRHRDRTAEEDGSFAAGFGAMDVMRARAKRTAIALASNGRVEVEPLPACAVRGIVQLILVNARAVDEFKSLFPTPYAFVRVTQERLARAPSFRGVAADPVKLEASRLKLLSNVHELGDISGDRMEAQLNLARSRMEGREAPREPGQSDIHHTMKIGCATDIYGACKNYGEQLLAQREHGAPTQEQHVSFYFGVYLHFLANGFKKPTPTDCGDLSLHWLFDEGTREAVIDRWRKRLEQPWAGEMRALAHEILVEQPMHAPTARASVRGIRKTCAA